MFSHTSRGPRSKTVAHCPRSARARDALTFQPAHFGEDTGKVRIRKKWKDAGGTLANLSEVWMDTKECLLSNRRDKCVLVE